MNGQASGSSEMLCAMLGGRVDKVGCYHVWEISEQYVILVGEDGIGIEMRSQSCSWSKWDGVKSCCIH